MAIDDLYFNYDTNGVRRVSPSTGTNSYYRTDATNTWPSVILGSNGRLNNYSGFGTSNLAGINNSAGVFGSDENTNSSGVMDMSSFNGLHWLNAYQNLTKLNYAVQQGKITNEDKEKYIKTGQMTSPEKLQAYIELCQELENNRQAVIDYLNEHEADGTYENGDVKWTEKGQTAYDTAMFDGFITEEERDKILAGEELEEQEDPLTDSEVPEEGKEGREEEVIAAYDYVMDAVESGQDLSTLNVPEGLNKGDVKRIISDLSDNGIVGDGAASAQFESDVIQNHIKDRSQRACDNKLKIKNGDKVVDYNGSYDNDDKRVTSSSGSDKSRDRREEKK